MQKNIMDKLPLTFLTPSTQAGIASQASTSDFDLNGITTAQNKTLTPASVFIGLIKRKEWSVIFTKRTNKLKYHPNQISFPGGKQEAFETASECAYRESFEEIGLQPYHIRGLRELPHHETVTNFDISPFIGVVSADFKPHLNHDEVGEIFEVPLAFVMTKAHYRIESFIFKGERRFYYTIPYGVYYIWGATARILKTLCDSATLKE